MTQSLRCQFCSEVSKANGEDPIGTVDVYDHWLMLELRPPWAKTLWMEPDPVPEPVHRALGILWEADLRLRPIAIAPDRYYSCPGYRRVIYYRRPQTAFATLHKDEYWVPEAIVPALLLALFVQPEQLPRFATYRQATQATRDLFVCLHGNVDVACSRFGYPIYRHLRQDYASASLRVWQCSHFGYHQFAPTLMDMPEGRCWGHVEARWLDVLVHRQGAIADIRHIYQGWGVLSRWEQIAEREIWIKEGWDWLTYLKSGETLAISDPEADYPDWAEVQIHFRNSDGSDSGTYEVRIEACGEVETMWNSGDQNAIETVKQYRVTRLIQSQKTNLA